MLNLEKFGGDVSGRRAAITGPQRQDAAVGSPIAYEEVDYLGADAWALLSAETQAWARGSAGEAIRDPHSGRSDEHWYCSVTTDRRAGAPRTAGRTAEYVLVSFGKRGLAVSTGATANFVAGPGSTRWTSARFDVPVDPSQIRHDHRVAAGPTGGDPADPAAASPFGGLLRPDFEARFGNLPAPTQLFWCNRSSPAAGPRPRPTLRPPCPCPATSTGKRPGLTYSTLAGLRSPTVSAPSRIAVGFVAPNFGTNRRRPAPFWALPGGCPPGWHLRSSRLPPWFRASPSVAASPPETLYQILQVDKCAQTEVIQAAYYRLARLYHPDSGSTPDPERMKRINQAWETLESVSKRATYDASLRQEETNSPEDQTPEAVSFGAPGWGETVVDRPYPPFPGPAQPTAWRQAPISSGPSPYQPGYYPPGPYGPGYGQPEAIYPPWNAPSPRKVTNTWAVVSFVLALTWIFYLGSALAVVFGFVALHDIKRRTGQRGRAWAITGIVIGGLALAQLAVFIYVAAASRQSTAAAISGLLTAVAGRA